MRNPLVQKSHYTVLLKSCWTCKPWSGLYSWVQFKKSQIDIAVVPCEFQTDLVFMRGNYPTASNRIWWSIYLFILLRIPGKILWSHTSAQDPDTNMSFMMRLQMIEGPRWKERSLRTGHCSQAPGKSNHLQHSVLVEGYLSPEYQSFKIQWWKLWNRIISSGEKIRQKLTLPGEMNSKKAVWIIWAAFHAHSLMVM